MTTVTYQVPAISCGHCVHTIQSELSEIPGVSRVKAASDTRQVLVEFAPPATDAIIRSRLTEINYPAVN
jgi:copper chaperone CopZ